MPIENCRKKIKQSKGGFKMLRNQKGFTLIEIIAVLVILGILAAVAIPKFMSMAEEAKKKAVEGALAAGASEVSLKFANIILTSGSTPTMAATASAASSPLGDFTFTYAAQGGSAVRVTVTGPADKISGVTPLTKDVVLR
jgi:prepilin-type N-terminal cleavage/methylation domain-containing protein